MVKFIWPKPFGLTRYTVTPKDFAPTRQWRDRSGVAILRNTDAISPNSNTDPVAEFNTPAPSAAPDSDAIYPMASLGANPCKPMSGKPMVATVPPRCAERTLANRCGKLLLKESKPYYASMNDTD
jgi:hypothetical protein